MFVPRAERSVEGLACLLVEEGDPGAPPGGGGRVRGPEDQLLVLHQQGEIVFTVLHGQRIYSSHFQISLCIV